MGCKLMNDQFFMEFALNLAKKTKGQTSPNPVVGTVVVKDGRIIGMGAHLKAGNSHAEVHALEMAGSLAKDSTIYVTLEPCSHYGKTPPCAKRIIEAKVKRVVIATLDPNPLVSGGGVELLEKAGIDITVGVLEDEAKKINEHFNKYITTRLPFVTVKTAMTIDGKVASYSGSSKWITGENARKSVHQIRHEHDAIMVGIGTVLKDNPFLNVRTDQPGISPVRVIIDSNLNTPVDANIITDKSAPTWLFTTSNAPKDNVDALEAKGIDVIVTSGQNEVPLHEALKYLGKNKITSVLVEGGPSIIGSLLDQQLIDKYITFIAPKLIGGRNAPSVIGGQGIESMSEAIQLKGFSVEQYDDDLCIIGYPEFLTKGGS